LPHTGTGQGIGFIAAAASAACRTTRSRRWSSSR
jgi:hypothetical protein